MTQRRDVEFQDSPLTQCLSCCEPYSGILHQKLLDEVLGTEADCWPWLLPEVWLLFQDLVSKIDTRQCHWDKFDYGLT